MSSARRSALPRVHDHHRALGRGPFRGRALPRGPRLLRRRQPAAGAAGRRWPSSRCVPAAPTRVAIVVDARGGVFFGELSKALEELGGLHVDARIVFLEASDEDLVNATRRRAAAIPLAPADRVVEGIRKERQMMAQLRGDADLVIDTSGLTPHELRDRVRDAFADAPPEEGLQVSIVSFGFKYGTPRDADLLFDVRFLPNPHWVRGAPPAARAPIPVVRDYVRNSDGLPARSWSGSRRCSTSSLPGYVREGKSLPHGRDRLHGRPSPLGRRGRGARRVVPGARASRRRRAPRRRARLTEPAVARQAPAPIAWGRTHPTRRRRSHP